MDIIDAILKLWEHVTLPKVTTKRRSIGNAVLAGAFAGVMAVLFYRAFLPWWLNEHKLSDIPGMVRRAMEDTRNAEVFYSLLAGALGGAAITLGSWKTPKRTATLLTRILVSLAGGAVLAATQEAVGTGQVDVRSWHPYWPEFYAFGAVATFAAASVVDFSSLRGIADLGRLCLVSPVVGAFAFGVVMLTLDALPGLSRSGVPSGFDGWLLATTLTCPVYLAALVTGAYLLARTTTDTKTIPKRKVSTPRF